jgi:hypothetical protein
MPDVFINYRTGDGNDIAALIDNELANRFGKDRAFRASRSIAPSSTYPDALLMSVRRSALLLAVIGADWINFQSRLHDPEDWVRKEIEEAFSCGVPVVPVLAGPSRLRRRTTHPDHKVAAPRERTRSGSVFFLAAFLTGCFFAVFVIVVFSAAAVCCCRCVGFHGPGSAARSLSSVRRPNLNERRREPLAGGLLMMRFTRTAPRGGFSTR